jgi:hypothetical protein
VIDVAAPQSVSEESRVAVCRTEYAVAAAVQGDLLYVADGRRGLKILQLTAGARPAEQAALYTGGDASGLAAAGGLVYLAAGSEGVKVVDASNPREPAQIAEIPSADARDVAAAGSSLLVLDAEEGLTLFDVGNPASPRRAASLSARIPAPGQHLPGGLCCRGCRPR